MATREIASNVVSQGKVKEEYFVRFCTRQRVEHIVLVVVFIILAVTGLVQRYYTVGWAEWVILSLGGIEYTRLIHRIFSLIFTLSVLYHFGYVAYSFFFKHRKLTMVPTLKDFGDVVGAVRYAFGLTDKSPKFERFDYRQKFEYWGLIFGSVILIMTGFILAFPIAFTRLLPGQIVAAAVEFHGFEATLAVLTITIWHLYDVMLRPGIFPADTSIFTGKISKKRMMEEHSLEYADFIDAHPGEKAGSKPPSEEPPA